MVARQNNGKIAIDYSKGYLSALWKFPFLYMYLFIVLLVLFLFFFFFKHWKGTSAIPGQHFNINYLIRTLLERFALMPVLSPP